MIRLMVQSGPDEGKEAVFRGRRVRVGRGLSNDFALTDAMVSQVHGEVVVQGDGVYWRDLRSRHGTQVRLQAMTVTLHDRDQPQEVELQSGSEILLGESLLRVGWEARDVPVAPPPRRPVATVTANTDEMQGEQLYKRPTANVDEVTQRLSRQDPRLIAIFRLSRSLNTVVDRGEVLDLVARMTFEAFPAANFFAVSMPEDPEHPEAPMAPVLTRTRASDRGEDQAPSLLSQSLLRQVFDRREAILFVRDETGMQPTESIVNARITACIAAPLVGPQRLIGVMQVDTRGTGGLFGPDDLDLFTVLASYAAFALERIELMSSIVDMFEAVVSMSVNATDARDPSTAGHSARVCALTLRLAERVNACTEGRFADVRFSDTEMRELRYATLLHDFGKIAVRERVLMKPTRLPPETLRTVRERLQVARLAQRLAHAEGRRDGPRDPEEALRRIDRLEKLVLHYQPGIPLPEKEAEDLAALGADTFTDATGTTRPLLDEDELRNMRIPKGTLNEDEWEDMRSHARHSEELLRSIPWEKGLERVPTFAGLHHEKLDGSGYPYGRKAEDLPLQVRMMTIADIFDAMTSADRPYRSAGEHQWALEVIAQMAAGGLLDPDLVALFHQDIEELGAPTIGL